MAAKKAHESQLLGPSEFSKKVTKSEKSESAQKGQEKTEQELHARHLIPPAQWKAKDVKKREKDIASHHSNLKKDGSILYGIGKSGITSTKSSHYMAVDEDKKQLEDTTKKLMAEIKSCKDENRKMHQDLTTQLQPLIEVSKDRKEHSRECEPPKSLQREERSDSEWNIQFQELLQTKVQKQTENIDKIMQRFLEHQSEINIDNEKLARKYSRLNEEYRDVKMHLEKQLEMKEKQCHSYFEKLQMMEEELQKMNRQCQTDVHRLESELRVKETALVNLQSIKDVDKSVFQQLQASRDAETKAILAEYNEKLASLKLNLSKCEKELQGEKDKNEGMKNTWWEKEKSFKEALLSRDDEMNVLKHELEMKGQELSNQSATLELSKKQLEEEQLKAQKLVYTYENDLEELKKNQGNLLKDEKQKAILMKTTLEEKSTELDKAKAEIKHLHGYITEKESKEESTQSLKTKLQALKEDNWHLKEKCTSLESATQFLAVQISSLNEVIKIQEKELSMEKGLLGSEWSSKTLSKWREKVYSLLVQLKSMEIADNETTAKLQIQLKDLERKSENSRKRNELLQTHIGEKDADLEVKSTRIKTISVEVSLLQEKISKQEQENEKTTICMTNLKSSIKMFQQTFSSKFEAIESRLRNLIGFTNRVQFAYKRLEMVKGLLDRKEAHLKSEFEKISSLHNGDENAAELPENEKKSLLKEIEHLTNDRKILTDQIRNDTVKLKTLEQKLKNEFEVRLQTRDEMIEKLEQELESVKREVDELNQEKLMIETEHSHLTEEFESLKLDLEGTKSQFHKELDSRLEYQREQHLEESSKMERIISEVRQEHTKAIVSLQQIERQMEWQRKNYEDVIKQNEEEYKYELSKLMKRSQELEKERNLLLTTIKQENLKPLRPTDMKSSLGNELNPEKTTHSKSRRNRNLADGTKKRTEKHLKSRKEPKLDEMLKELQTISASLLQEDEAIQANQQQKGSDDGKSDEL